MSTEATTQVLSDAVDAAGVSTVTTTRTVANPRNGIIYNPTTFAAGIPVWFHRLQDGRYLALFKNRWHDAISVYHDGPQLFSTHTEDTTPWYAYIDPTTGAIDGPYPWIGLDTLSAAVSRGDYLFTLGLVGGVATVQHHIITRLGGLQFQASEPVPLNFHLGLYPEGFHLHVFGAGGDGKLARIRKHWGRIGVTTDAQNQWEYQGSRGWYTDPAEAVSLASNLPAAGPCSMAKMRDRYYLMATQYVSGSYQGVVYTARAVDQTWRLLTTTPILLGGDDTYLGGAAYLQPQLVVNRSLLPDGARDGFPYVSSTLVVVGPDQTILTSWGILSV